MATTCRLPWSSCIGECAYIHASWHGMAANAKQPRCAAHMQSCQAIKRPCIPDFAQLAESNMTFTAVLQITPVHTSHMSCAKRSSILRSQHQCDGEYQLLKKHVTHHVPTTPCKSPTHCDHTTQEVADDIVGCPACTACATCSKG